MDIFENICRTCGNDCVDAMNIFEDSAMVNQKNVPISELLFACQPASSISLLPLSQHDDYPKQICAVCVKKLMLIYEFNNKWITSSSEFSVALKFEQRRKRGRFSQPSLSEALAANEPDNVPIQTENIVFKHEPYEDNIEIIDEKELVQIKYQCGNCEMRFFTLAAFHKHHKVTHPGRQADWNEVNVYQLCV